MNPPIPLTTPDPTGSPPVPAPPRVYRLHGLRIRSARALAGFPASGDDWDVDVRWGPVGPVPSHPTPGEVLAGRFIGDRIWYVATRTGQYVTLRLPGVCDFVIDTGRQVVECRPDPAADDRFVAVLVAGLVVAFLLSLAGHFSLHASAVESGGRAIAIAGDTGMGKSTLAAVLCAAGARLVTDDVLRLGVDKDNTVTCVGGAPQLRLRPAAAWAVERFSVPVASSTTVDGRLAIEPASDGGRPLPLAVILLVRPSPARSEIDLRPLRGAEALVQLAAVTRIVGWKDRSVLRRQLDALSATARSVPVVEAHIPWAPSTASSVAAKILGRTPSP